MFVILRTIQFHMKIGDYRLYKMHKLCVVIELHARTYSSNPIEKEYVVVPLFF